MPTSTAPRIEPAVPTAAQVADTFAAAGLLVTRKRAREIAAAKAAGETSPYDWIIAKADAGSLSLLDQQRYNAALFRRAVAAKFNPQRARDAAKLAEVEARIARIEAYQVAQSRAVAA